MSIYSPSATSFTNPYKFSCYRNAALNPGTGGLVTFDTEYFDTSSNYSTSTGKFTTPIPGFYFFQSTINWTAGVQGEAFAYWEKNGSQVGPYFIDAQTLVTTSQGFSGSILLSLAAGDYVQVFAGSANSIALNVGPTRNIFTGFLVSAT